jgi:predicted nuclease of predicted toxin-antitoxin system
MKFLFDMNLPPTWVRFLEENGFEAVQWSTTPRASTLVLTYPERGLSYPLWE